LSPEAAAALAARLGHPLHDPHGDTIPDSGEALPADAGQSVNTIEPGKPFTIVHVEDEPEALYGQLLQMGLRPGMRAYVMGKTSEKLRLWADGREFELVPSMAQQLSVLPLDGVTRSDLREERFLDELGVGRRGRVLGLSSACRGAERRRLLDLGFVPGSMIEANLASPLGDPTGYLVRGAVVALRREQARHVRIAPELEVAA
jgi:DtxR family Mn-dependent transcriptional regulator